MLRQKKLGQKKLRLKKAGYRFFNLIHKQ